MIENIESATKTALIDASYSSNLAYKPQLISNDYKAGRKVLSSIEEELSDCESFMISVAFITMSGITPLLQTLKELEMKGVSGKILTTDYLTFSEPKALDKLASLQNIELKMYRSNKAQQGFHTKGYLFQRNGSYSIIVGSSNMTLSALTCNKEWNTKLVSTEQGEYAKNVLSEFDDLWNSDFAVPYNDFINQYREEYRIIKEQKRIAKEHQVVELEQYKLRPNLMQVEFIKNLKSLRENGAKRALLISATGTGKTYASAFALREENPRKALFIVHREQIAKQALKSYKKVFGKTKQFGLLSGTQKDYNADYLFATMQMMSKKSIMEQFAPDTFDTIIIDEVHRAGADSYQRIMSYFKPKFWLGMTASPERMDGFNIFELFDYNIAYEIRLGQALEENLLCPFHYFGITELDVDGQTIDDNASFNHLVCDERVNHIIEQAEYYGHSGKRVKGLVFCRNINDGKALSEKFNLRGYRTIFLSGDTSQDVREASIERLTQDEYENGLDYIFTVDIFNEGVDIPEVNQVIMLRPTQSPVIFVQQLGRGLRKTEEKEYVVILDFIGNYSNNFMIPIALSGDRSYNKDTIRKYVREGSRVIPGSSTIHFDEISKKRIFDSIDAAKTNEMKLLKESYIALKNKLGKIPSIDDFKKYGSLDITKFFDKCGSYHNFLKKYERDYSINLNEIEEEIIEFLSKKLVSYKRIHEVALLKYLVQEDREIMIYEFEHNLSQIERKFSMSSQVEISVYRNLTNEFPKEAERSKYEHCILISKKEKGYALTDCFQEYLQNEKFKSMVLEILDYGIEKCSEEYSDFYKDTHFQLYKKYTYEDVCRLLNWKQNMNAQNIGGYFYDAYTKTLPVFINYDKTPDAIDYEDRFLSEDKLIALSKHPRQITSPDVTRIYKLSEEDKDNRIFLFVRKNKNDNEAKEFYFLGEIYAEESPNPVHLKKTDDDAFEIQYRLEVPVRNDIYDYIVGD